MPKATLIFQQKKIYADGKILQMRIWVVPASVKGSSHNIKYYLFYGQKGCRILAYDNEAGKGDHIHRGDIETNYTFVSPEQLVMDFLSEVRALRKGAI